MRPRARRRPLPTVAPPIRTPRTRRIPHDHRVGRPPVPMPNWLQRLRWYHVLAALMGASVAGGGAAVLLDGLLTLAA